MTKPLKFQVGDLLVSNKWGKEHRLIIYAADDGYMFVVYHPERRWYYQPTASFRMRNSVEQNFSKIDEIPSDKHQSFFNMLGNELGEMNKAMARMKNFLNTYTKDMFKVDLPQHD